MLKLKGSVTTVEKMDVEVTPEELRTVAIKSFTPYELVHMAYRAWLKERHLGVDVELKKTSQGKYYFTEYENNGSHYSGYYDRPSAYREGDEVVFKEFHDLMESLK